MPEEILPRGKCRAILIALYFLPVSILLLLVVGPIFRDGMFIDGLAYVNLAKNLSMGIGEGWRPLVDPAGPVFYEHPPLVFIIESYFFRLFGDSKYVEDICNLSVLLLTLLILWQLMKRFVGVDAKYYFFAPFMLFVLSQEVQLRYPNNMLECTLSLFALAGVYFYLALRDNHQWLSLLLVGVASLLAFLCKGPVGLFPLIVPGLYSLIVDRKFSFKDWVMPGVTFTASLGFLFLLIPESFQFLKTYNDVQVSAALLGNRHENIADSRFAIMKGLVLLNVPQIALFVIVAIAYRKRFKGWMEEHVPLYRTALFLFIVGLAAILPIMISEKQATYYQIPSLPYFYLSISLFLYPAVMNLVKKLARSNRWLSITSIAGAVFIIGSLGFAISKFGKTDRRNVKDIAEAGAIAELMQKERSDRYYLVIEDKVGAKRQSYSYNVPAYLNRFHNIFAVNDPGKSEYRLSLKNSVSEELCQDGWQILFATDRVCFQSGNDE